MRRRRRLADDDDAALVRLGARPRGRIDADDDLGVIRARLGREALAFDQRARPERAGRLFHDLGEQLLSADRAALVARGDALQESLGEMMVVVEGRTAGDSRVLVGDELLDQLDRARRRRDDRLRLVAEAQSEHRLIEGVGMAPGREFVQPELHVLLAAQPVGLLGGKQLRHGAVRPAQALGSAGVTRALRRGADRHQAGLAQHHDVPDVVVGGADQVDDGEALDPLAHGFGARARLAGAAPGQNDPIDPVAWRRLLVRTAPEGPVVKEFRALLRSERGERAGAVGGAQLQEIVEFRYVRPAAVGRPGRAPPSRAALPGVGRRHDAPRAGAGRRATAPLILAINLRWMSS